MPIDLVCGTSIGGLVGGLYAVGYTQEEMEELFRTMDWNVMLTDYVPQNYIPYSTKVYNAQYVLSIPFDNPREVFNKPELQEEGQEYRRQSITSTLPSGVNYGFNVMNMISSLTVGYHDSTSFAKFTVPFMCVASDMISLKAKNWGSGELGTAMRSTMSIPGLFNPVRTDGMVLVDGGMKNNFPSDLARAVGADYIIGIELSDSKPGYDDVNNIFDIVGQLINMLGEDTYEKNRHLPDILIKPEISEYNMMSFSREAVDTMLIRGYAAAKEKEDELIELREKLRSQGTQEKPARAIDISKRGVKIASISFEGTNEKEATIMSRYLDFEVGDTLTKKDLDHVTMKFQATGAYSAVTYSLYGSEEPFDLVFHFDKSPAHNVGIGLRVDTEELAALMLNVGINTYTLTGSSLNFNAKLGRNMKAELHYAFNPTWAPTVNVSASVSRYKGDLGVNSDETTYGISYWTHKEQVFLSDANWTKFNFNVGVKNHFAGLSKSSYLGALVTANLGEDALSGNYVGTFVTGHLYTFDDYYYPKKGTRFDFAVNYDFAKLGDATFEPVLSIGGDFKTVIPLGEKFALIPDLHVREIINTGERSDDSGNVFKNLSVLHTNLTGGSFAGRYSENQIPFFGIDNVVISEEYLTSATLELRYNAAKNFYVSAMGGFVESADKFLEQFHDLNVDCWAVGVELGYDLPIGPIKVNLHWSNNFGAGVYASLGFDF